VIVIGTGSTGENVADRAVKGGLTAAIIESKLVGGECSYRAEGFPKRSTRWRKRHADFFINGVLCQAANDYDELLAALTLTQVSS